MTADSANVAARKLMALHDRRPVLRTLLHVDVSDAGSVRHSDGGGAGDQDASAVLDFVASTATLDRYHEVIEPARWKLDSYRHNPVVPRAHNYADVIFHAWEGAED